MPWPYVHSGDSFPQGPWAAQERGGHQEEWNRCRRGNQMSTQTPCSRKVPYPEHLLSERREQRKDTGYPNGVTFTCSRCRATQPRGILQTLTTKLNIWNLKHLEIAYVKVLMNSKDHSYLKDHSIYLVAQGRLDLKYIPDSFLSLILPLQESVPNSCPYFYF